MKSTLSRWMLALSAMVLVAGLTGCKNTNLQEERDRLYSQNVEAQKELDNTRLALDKAEADRAGKDADLARLQDELNGMKNRPPQVIVQQVPGPAQPAAPAGSGGASKGGSGHAKPLADSDIEVFRGKEGLTVRVPGDVLFDSGKADIKTSAKATLDRVAVALKRDYAGKQLKVEGFTDSDPIKKSKWKSNQQLSEARAAAVKAYLSKQGVPASRMETIGFGATHLRETKAKSRRVEIVVIGAK